jgi:hypothetical protein
MLRTKRPRRPRPERRELTAALEAYYKPIDVYGAYWEDATRLLIEFDQPFTLRNQDMTGLRVRSPEGVERVITSVEQRQPDQLQVNFPGGLAQGDCVTVHAAIPGLNRIVNFVECYLATV